jgi:F-type H+-transporting ATPase subunit epsilon
MITSKPFNLTIIQPDKIIYDGKAVSLVAPCESGYLGVMADHAALAANIVAGSITVKPQAGQQAVIFTSRGKGFLEVLNNNVSLVLNYTDAEQ